MSHEVTRRFPNSTTCKVCGQAIIVKMVGGRVVYVHKEV